MRKAFTLIEILVVIGIIAILAAIVIVAINPARQFAQARNTQRQSNILAILNAVHQNAIDNTGIWTCKVGGVDIPLPATTLTEIGNATLDICSCLVPTYLTALPNDPSKGSGADCTTYATGYKILQDGTTGRITVNAPSAELGKEILLTR